MLSLQYPFLCMAANCCVMIMHLSRRELIKHVQVSTSVVEALQQLRVCVFCACAVKRLPVGLPCSQPACKCRWLFANYHQRASLTWPRALTPFMLVCCNFQGVFFAGQLSQCCGCMGPVSIVLARSQRRINLHCLSAALLNGRLPVKRALIQLFLQSPAHTVAAIELQADALKWFKRVGVVYDRRHFHCSACAHDGGHYVGAMSTHL